MHLLIEQVLVLTKDIFRCNIVRKYYLVVALVEHYPVAVCFGCVRAVVHESIGYSSFLSDLYSSFAITSCTF